MDRGSRTIIKRAPYTSDILLPAVYSVSTNTAHTTVSIRYALLSTSAMNYV